MISTLPFLVASEGAPESRPDGSIRVRSDLVVWGSGENSNSGYACNDTTPSEFGIKFDAAIREECVGLLKSAVIVFLHSLFEEGDNTAKRVCNNGQKAPLESTLEGNMLNRAGEGSQDSGKGCLCKRHPGYRAAHSKCMLQRP